MTVNESHSVRVDFTNFTERSLGLGRGLLNADLEKISRIAPPAAAAVRARRDSGDLRWINLFDQDISDILAFAQSVEGRYDNIVVLGIGGSALGLTAMHTALCDPFPQFGRTGDQPRLVVLDNIDPFIFASFLEQCDLSRSLFFVISKSGSTAETMSQYLIVKQKLRDAGLPLPDHMVAITDPSGGILRDIVNKENLTAFPVPDGVGGRFSVLSPVGLVPAALVGIDIRRLLDGSREFTLRALNEPIERNPALFLATALFLLSKKGYRNHVMMPYSSRLKDMADWYRQLWAESLGKRYDRSGRLVETGVTPIKALGATDQHSQVQLYVEGPRDKAFIFVGVRDHGRVVDIPVADGVDAKLGYLGGHTMNELIEAEMLGTIVALSDDGRPNCLIELDRITPETVAGFLVIWELSTAFIGELMDINAYDQPGVEAGKNAAYALMGRSGYEQIGRAHV